MIDLAEHCGLARGVYLAPWVGPNGEVVLIALRTDGRLACEPVTVPDGRSRLEANERLWNLLDARDPERRPLLKVMR
jgi:hypothetical protein